MEARGQECSLREAKTEDGYLLTVHRVHSPGLPYGPPVLLIHGLLSASDQWLVYGRDHDLRKSSSLFIDEGLPHLRNLNFTINAMKTNLRNETVHPTNYLIYMYNEGQV